MVFTALENKTILMKTFEVKMEGGTKILEEEGKIVMEELGPNVEMTLRRHNFADPDIFKKATYIPKSKKKKAKKNLLRDSIGNERRKLYVDRQDLSVLPTKKRKLISKDDNKTGYKKNALEKLGKDKHED